MPNNQEQEKNIVQQAVEKKGKKLVRDKALKLGKAAGKAAFKIAANVAMGIGKTLLGLLAGVGLPYLLIIGGVLLAVFIIYIATALFFVNEPSALTEEGQELREYIIQVADETVDMDRPEQIPYRVPHELLITAIQIYDSVGEKETKKALKDLAEALKPIFTYETFIGQTETITTTCTDGSCSSHESTSEFEVEMLTHVEAWDRIMDAEVFQEKGPWETSTSSSTSTSTDEDGNTSSSTTTVTTKTRSDVFWTEETIVYDYTLFDRELSKKPFKYEDESKKSVEAIYEITGGEIYYSEWLAGDSIVIDSGRGGPVGNNPNGNGFDGTVTPGAGIPPEFMEIYLAAEKKYGVDWYYLAAIHFIETKFSTVSPMLSSVGAEGHMQFMPCTWVGWSHPSCKGSGGAPSMSDSVKHDLSVIKKHGGYGVDASGDGKADPFDVWDAVFTAANYLKASGFATNVSKAIRAYNHSDVYVNNVVAKAKEYKDAATYTPNGGGETNPGGFGSPTPGQLMTMTYGVGPRQYAGSTRWTNHNGIDIHTKPRHQFGVSIIAIADGVVSEATGGCPKIGSATSRCNGGFGNNVKIMHEVGGKKYYTIYAHLDSVAISANKPVKQGDYLGTMGTSGTSTAVHLHLEMRAGGAGGAILHGNNYVPLAK